MLWSKISTTAIITLVVGIYTAIFLVWPVLILQALIGLAGLVIMSACLAFLWMVGTFFIDEINDFRARRRRRRDLKALRTPRDTRETPGVPRVGY